MAEYKVPFLMNSEDEDDVQDKINISTGRNIISLSLSKQLGQGAFGTVFKARDERGVDFAVKKIDCPDQQSCIAVAQEIQILIELQHPNIVKMHAFDFLRSSAVLVMEYCEHGTLNSRLKMPVAEENQLLWVIQLASGLKYLHENNIVHRDLKCENILLKNEDTLKITDFGISREFVCFQGKYYNKDDETYISQYLNAYMGTFAGTPFWVAPEVFDLKYNEAADIFSLGAIYYAILERRSTVFNGTRYYGLFSKYNGEDVGIGLVMSETHQQIIPEFKIVDRFVLEELITQMVNIEPGKRPIITDIYATVNEVYGDYLTENLKKHNEENEDEDENGSTLFG